MPWVLMGMGLALLIGVLTWSRAWSHRDRAAVVAATWQAQLLAESALACAADELWDRISEGSKQVDTSNLASLVDAEFGLDSTPTCGSPSGTGSMEWSFEEGQLLAPVVATGEVRWGNRTIHRRLRAILSGALDRDLFDVAVSQWEETPTPLDISGSRIVGNVRVRTKGTPPPGMKAQPRGPKGLVAYVPTSRVLDTAVLEGRMRERFRDEDAFSGSARYSSGFALPDRKEVVHTSFGAGYAVVELEGGLSSSNPWKPPARSLFVEGDIRVSGKVLLDGWTLVASGSVLLDRGSVLRSTTVYAEKGVEIAEDASFQGQILAFRSLEVSGEARVANPSVLLCWAGDSGAQVRIRDRSVVNAYLVTLGKRSQVEIERGALVEGVVVSLGSLQVEGAVHGVSVAGTFVCGREGASCTGSGTFDRSRLPVDFAVPLGLPGTQGLRVARWEAR